MILLDGIEIIKIIKISILVAVIMSTQTLCYIID